MEISDVRIRLVKESTETLQDLVKTTLLLHQVLLRFTVHQTHLWKNNFFRQAGAWRYLNSKLYPSEITVEPKMESL